MDAILDRKVEVGQKIGVAPDQNHPVSWELETLRKQGILIDLNVSGIGMFQVAAKWDEIGIQANSDDPRLERLRPGCFRAITVFFGQIIDVTDQNRLEMASILSKHASQPCGLG